MSGHQQPRSGAASRPAGWKHHRPEPMSRMALAKRRMGEGPARHHRLSLTSVKAYSRFKISILDKHKDMFLEPFDPLSMDINEVDFEKEDQMPEKEGWCESLSKIPVKILKGHRHTVTSCHYCVEDTKVLSSSYDGTLLLWDMTEGAVVQKFHPQPRAPVSECSITADSRKVIAASFDKKVKAWDLETGQQLWETSHETLIRSCKISPDGKYVVSCLDVDCGICILDAQSTATLSYIKDHHQRSITACCFDPDSQRVASVSLDRNIKIWDVSSRSTLLTITKAHENAVSNCCFTSSGHFLCTSSWDKTLKIWNVHSGEYRNCGACVTLMKGHEGSVSSCDFSRDTSYLVSGGYDKTVVIWDVAEGYRKLALKGHEDWVMDVAISDNKKWILSASKDKTMRLWNIEQLDHIPVVIEQKRALGLKMNTCDKCDRPFSLYESDIFSEKVTKCAFCRMDGVNLSAEDSEESLEREMSIMPRESEGVSDGDN